MATHSSTLAWRISWTEEPGRLQSHGITCHMESHVTCHMELDMTEAILAHTHKQKQGDHFGDYYTKTNHVRDGNLVKTMMQWSDFEHTL